MSEPRTGLEARVAEALEHGAAGAPPAVGLAAAARGRAARRRRTRLAGAAAVVALAVAVPSVVLATGGDGGRDHGPGPAGRTGSTTDAATDTATDAATDPVPGSDDPANGYHWESWHDVTLQVPNTWAHGSLGDWCVGGGTTDTPRIQRPDTPTDMILCSPRSTYGVSFAALPSGANAVDWPVAAQSGDSWPAGAEVGARSVGRWVITVAARKSTVAQAVLDSARSIGPDGDANGCTSARGEARTDVVEGTLVLCRYGEDGLLEQSEQLTGDAVAEAVAAVRAAPTVPATRDCLADPTLAVPLVRLRTVGLHADVDLGGSCPAIHGLDGDRLLTADVLYWALSPGWSGDATGLPLPEAPRQE